MRTLTSVLTIVALSLGTAACATSSMDDYADADGESAAPGSVDLWQSTDGQFRFHFLAGNKNVLFTSEGYTTRTNAIGGILSVLDNGVDAAQYETVKATNGKYFLRLHAAANGQVIASTQLYATKSSATRAIASCVRAVGSYLDQVFSAGDRPHVEVNADSDGSFAFSVVDAAGTVVLTSHKYASEASAWNGAFAIQAGALNAPSCQVAQQAEGFSFTATAENGSVVATSPSYATQAQADAALAAARALVPSIDIL